MRKSEPRQSCGFLTKLRSQRSKCKILTKVGNLLPRNVISVFMQKKKKVGSSTNLPNMHENSEKKLETMLAAIM